MRRLLVTSVLAVLAFGLLAPVAPSTAAPLAPAALAALRDELAAAAPVGSAALVDPETGQVVVRVAGPASARFLRSAATHRHVTVVGAPPVRPAALLLGGQPMDSIDGRLCSTGLLLLTGRSSLVLIGLL
ncbi:hypothetical protein [Micromonospora echinofusca]|uniref:Uncharacterized protein n=1 Tax=Micromonospora echinofusca TaxID=47858 RepID=A0ABS3VIW5_MICEH|nr:hypothetical protein [Micromonospora echinofusca]MBO4204467.1 hypothetical protein [Micromonospora echinofusca]